MKGRQKPIEPSLTPKEIQAAVCDRLAKYDNLNVLEQYAMFMGAAQILEYGLKGLLHRKYNVDIDKTERWTLGRTSAELKKHGLRGDFVLLLESVVSCRNYIAHAFLANEAMLRSLLNGKSGRLEVRHLQRAIYELEQLMFLYDWTEAHDAWN
jgi:hypothetical protein